MSKTSNFVYSLRATLHLYDLVSTAEKQKLFSFNKLIKFALQNINFK
jgi:hypothetical protein